MCLLIIVAQRKESVSYGPHGGASCHVHSTFRAAICAVKYNILCGEFQQA